MNDRLILDDAAQAKQLLNNKFFQEHIWMAMHKLLDNRTLSCDTANEPQEAVDIIRCRQMLDDFENIAKKSVKQGEDLIKRRQKDFEKEQKKIDRENNVQIKR